MNIQTGMTVLSPMVRTQDQKVAPPTGQGPHPPAGSAIERVADTLMDTGYFAFNEIVEVGKNDPALALRYGATSLSEQILTGVGENVRAGFAAAIIPTIRLSVLGANGYRLNKTLKDPTAGKAEKALDIARVATDVMGLAGSVLKYAWPSKAALGDTLVGVSYAADSVSHAVRMMTHGAERVSVWKKQLAERKAARAKQPNVQVPVVPVPVTPAVPQTTAAPTVLLQT